MIKRKQREQREKKIVELLEQLGTIKCDLIDIACELEDIKKQTHGEIIREVVRQIDDVAWDLIKNE